ncbi:MAG: uroporphyrinogen-III synthase [Bacteroidota bacterium]|nr:uroporphyrinogen-III synthase [Bacteroidota bacterium]
MSEKITVLSTKQLTDQQTLFLEEAGFSVLSMDFIEIRFLDFSLKKIPSLLLFTSQNAVKSVVQSPFFKNIQHIPAICVGTKTKEVLQHHGVGVLDCTDYAEELSSILIANFSKKNIAFFAGNIRRDTLPDAMRNYNISFTEYTVYQTTQTPHQINHTPSVVLFYSPSGVRSYLAHNPLKHSQAICIGTTTAQALQGNPSQIHISEKATIESVLEKCRELFG